MIELIQNIPGPTFLIIYLLLSVLIITASYFLINTDSSPFVSMV